MSLMACVACGGDHTTSLCAENNAAMFGPGERIKSEHVAWLCFRHRADNEQPYLVICDSDVPGAFKVYR